MAGWRTLPAMRWPWRRRNPPLDPWAELALEHGLNVQTPPEGESEDTPFHERFGLAAGRVTHLAESDAAATPQLRVALQTVPSDVRTRVAYRLHLIAERPEPLLPTAWRARAAGHPLELQVQRNSSGGDVVRSGDDGFDAAVHVLSREAQATAAALTPDVRDALAALFASGRPAGTLVAGGGLLRWTADEEVGPSDPRVGGLMDAFKGLAHLEVLKPA